MSAWNYVIVVQLTALPSWLSLSRPERRVIVDGQVTPALAAHPACSMRWLDAEAMTANCSDIALIETADLREWNHLWERIRDTDLFAVPHFRLESLVVGVEDAYLDFEASAS